MKNESTPISCCTDSDCCPPKVEKSIILNSGVVRSDFLKTIGLTGPGLLFGFPAFGMNKRNEKYTIPTDKGLTNDWYKRRYERGEPEIYSGARLAYVGMPIRGLFAGTVYLYGDGKLWLWDIFNKQKEGISDRFYPNWESKKQIKPRDGSNFVFYCFT